MENPTAQAVIEELRAEAPSHVKVAVTDIDGVLRGKYLATEKFLSALGGGFGFCDVVFGWDSSDDCYDNTTYTGWQSGYPDATVRIDLSTHRRIPWEDGRHLFLGRFVGPDDARHDVCPRSMLTHVLDRAAALGVEPVAGMEFEWFNFRETPQSLHAKSFVDPEPLTPGMFGYSVVRQAHNQPYFDALLAELDAYGVPLEGLHTETGPGVFEAAIAYSGALDAADRGVLFKTGVKEIAHRFGILPTFMARWNTDLPGCSGHVHQSLRSATGEALFHDADAPFRMSATFRSYLAGVLTLLPELLVLLAPTVNSYKRLVDGYWAPTRATWGVDNRTVACRVIPGRASSTRLELRVPGADVNPYLAVAAGVAAGLWGVERGLDLDAAPVVGNGYAVGAEAGAPFARDLHEATEALAASSVAAELFGAPFVQHLVETREWEWRRYGAAVTDWELRRYLEII